MSFDASIQNALLIVLARPFRQFQPRSNHSDRRTIFIGSHFDIALGSMRICSFQGSASCFRMRMTGYFPSTTPVILILKQED